MVRRVLGVVASLLIALSMCPGQVAAASFVLVSPRLSLLIWPEEVELHGTATVGFTIVNPSAAIPLTGVGFSATIPSGLQLGNGAPGSWPMCGGTLSFAGSLLKLAGASIQAGGDCHFAGLLRGNKAGTWTITTNRVTSLNGGTGNSASATLKVIGPATAAPVGPGQTAMPAVTPTALASPSESPTASPSPSLTPDPSPAPLAPSGTSGGEGSTPWLAMILASVLGGATGGLVAGGLLLFVPRRRSRPV